MDRIVQVKVGLYRPVHYFHLTEDIVCRRGDCVIMKVERGHEYGEVVSKINGSSKVKPELASGRIVRLVTPEDLEKIENNKKKAQEARNVCVRKIVEHKLKMQLVDVEYIFDGSKVIFYFTADGRVDFRVLVKDLARIFKVRIELKQIGVRDKAKIKGGLGVCGRELCCASYMKGFHPLTIKMPKEQGLPLNPSRISGICWRIKCCMAYEFAIYRTCARNLPRMGEKINTPQGQGKVFEVNVLRKYVRVDLGEGKVTKVSYAGQSDEQ